MEYFENIYIYLALVFNEIEWNNAEQKCINSCKSNAFWNEFINFS